MNDDLLDLLQRFSVVCSMLDDDIECELLTLEDTLHAEVRTLHLAVNDVIAHELARRQRSNLESLQ